MNFDFSKYKNKIVTAEKAAKLVHDNDKVLLGINVDIAYDICDALWSRRKELHNVELGLSNDITCHPIFSSSEDNPFKKISSFFLGPGERAAIQAGRILDYTSVHLSQVDLWFKYTFRPTICFFNVSMPDKDGYVSFGPAGSCASFYGKEIADRIVLQINSKTPYVYGNEYSKIHLSEADAIIFTDRGNPTLEAPKIDEATKKISKLILEFIPDGATLQLGIGSLASAIGFGLQERNDLGIHTELLSDSFMQLMKNGNVTNKYNGYLKSKSLFGFAMGSQDFYGFMDKNPEICSDVFPRVNNVVNIAKNDNMISINGAMSINLFGEIAADSIAYKQQSAVGGQLDFVRGAQLAKNGKSIIACSSSFIKNGIRYSRIVLDFDYGTPITTPRSDTQYVATEFGCINIKNLALHDRVKALISLAHPDFRDQLMDEAREHKLI